MSKQEKAKPCSTGSEIQVRYCLVRRALAFDQSNLLDFKLMELESEKLLRSRSHVLSLLQPRPVSVSMQLEKTREANSNTVTQSPKSRMHQQVSQAKNVFHRSQSIFSTHPKVTLNINSLKLPSFLCCFLQVDGCALLTYL